MSPDNGAEHQSPETPETPEPIRLTIDFDPTTQQVLVNGPIKNRMLSYAMLKLAEKAMDEDYERDKAKRIILSRDPLPLRNA